MIKITSPGLKYMGALLNVGSSYNFDVRTETSMVSTGLAVFIPGGTAKPPRIFPLAQSNVQLLTPNNTSENVLWSYVIPGGTLGPSGTLRITSIWSCTSNANNKTVYTKFGGSLLGSNNFTTAQSYKEERSVSNRNNQAAQLAFIGASGGYGITSSAVSNLSIDTTLDQTISLSATKANGPDVLALESVIVEVLEA